MRSILSFPMLLLFIICFAVSLAVCLTLVLLPSHKCSWMLDRDTSSIQKFHTRPVPRLGGVALFMSFVAAAFCINFFPEWVTESETGVYLALLLLAALPAFCGGMVEDLTKKVSPLLRLLLTFCSAIIGFYLLDAQTVRLGWELVDYNILTLSPIALAVTVFMVGGVSHSVNIVDGYHGLMPGLMLMVFAAMACISYQLNDVLMLQINLIIMAAILGLLVVNFPFGWVFSGDGGAYLLGYLAATVSLLMVNRNAHLSPWFAALLMAFPVWETIFSIYRRKFLHRGHATRPDDLHFHNLVYKCIRKRWIFDGAESHHAAFNHSTLTNAMVSPCIWLFCLLVNLIPALLFWHHTKLLIFFTVGFVLLYTYIYWKLTRFIKAKKLEGV